MLNESETFLYKMVVDKSTRTKNNELFVDASHIFKYCAIALQIESHKLNLLHTWQYHRQIKDDSILI